MINNKNRVTSILKQKENGQAQSQTVTLEKITKHLEDIRPFAINCSFIVMLN